MDFNKFLIIRLRKGFEGIKGVIKSRKSKTSRQYNDQKNKQWYTKHYTDN